MKITGHKIKQELKMLETDKEALLMELEGSYNTLPDDKVTRKPLSIFDDLVRLDEKICLWQQAQGWYNQIITCEYKGKQVPLAYIIKLDGALNRASSVLKKAAKDNQPRTRHMSVEKDTVYPVCQLNVTEVFARLKLITKDAAELQSLIGTQNSVELDITTLS